MSEPYFEDLSSEVERLMLADPRLPVWTALTIAQDASSKARAREHLDRGWEQAMQLVGSYGRMELVVELLAEGKVRPEDVYPRLPSLWRGSDPDDRDPRFLALWEDAWRANRRETITDGDDLPPGRYLTIYRGQDDGDKPGIAWSLDVEVARKFAHGAATRQHDRGGVVLEAVAPRRLVMAYVTGRGESEVIVNPFKLGGPL